MKVTYEQYRKDHCNMCGSQRCDSSREMMQACWPFRKANLQGLCISCIRARYCDEAIRWLDMKYCSEYLNVVGYSRG